MYEDLIQFLSEDKELNESKNTYIGIKRLVINLEKRIVKSRKTSSEYVGRLDRVRPGRQEGPSSERTLSRG